VYSATPYALLLGDGAPILQIEGKNWPFLHPIIGNRPALSVWMPAGTIPIPNARASRPCLLKSSRAIHWISESSDYLSFKGQAIRWVNRNLGNNDLATSETTIGVILCLMSFEVNKMGCAPVFLRLLMMICFLDRSREEISKSWLCT